MRTCKRPTPGRMQSRDRVNYIQSCADSAFGFGFVGEREAEESDDAIAEYPEDISVVAVDASLAGLLVCAKDDLHCFGVELVGELGESYHVAEQHSQLTPFAGRCARPEARPISRATFPRATRWSIRFRGPNGRPSSLRSLSVSIRSVARSISFSSKISRSCSRPWDLSQSESDLDFIGRVPYRFAR